MEEGIDLYSSNGRGIKITPKQQAICKCLNEFNQLRDFKLSDIEILEWMDSLTRLINPEPEALQFAIDQLMLGKIPYDKSSGIKTLFDALKLVEKTEIGYRIKSTLKPW